MTMKAITIRGEEHTLGGQTRAMLMWEEIKEKPFELKLKGDILLYYYCLLLAGNNDFPYSWDEFLTIIDEEPTLPMNIEQALIDASKVEAMMKKTKAKGKKKA